MDGAAIEISFHIFWSDGEHIPSHDLDRDHFAEYASVGYMAKRIQMRKNRFLALQKMAEQKKNEALSMGNAAMNEGPDHHGIPKQTVSALLTFPVHSLYHMVFHRGP